MPDSRPSLPTLGTLMGVTYYARTSDGQWHYHGAGGWVTCPPPVSEIRGDLEAAGLDGEGLRKAYEISFVWNDGVGGNAFTIDAPLPEDKAQDFFTAVETALGTGAHHFQCRDWPTKDTVEDEYDRIIAMLKETPGAHAEDIARLEAYHQEALHSLDAEFHLNEVSWVDQNDVWRRHFAMLTDRERLILIDITDQAFDVFRDATIFPVDQTVQKGRRNACDAAAVIIRAAEYNDVLRTFDPAKALWQVACEADGQAFWLPDVPSRYNPVRLSDCYYAIVVTENGTSQEVFATQDVTKAHEHFETFSLFKPQPGVAFELVLKEFDPPHHLTTVMAHGVTPDASMSP